MMSTTIKRPLSAALVCAALVFASPARAVQTFTVDSTLDGIDDDTSDGVCHTVANTCTLRAAVMQANRSSGDGATIMLPAGTFTLTRPAANSDGEDNGDLNLTAPASGAPVIAIIGAGMSRTIIDANQIDRVFHVEASRTAIIRDVAIRGGYVSGPGGGIFNKGTLTLDHVVIGPQNQTSDLGGGIYNQGSITLRNVAVVGNVSSLGGGGFFNEQNAIVSASTFAFNTGYLGGGIYNYRNLVLIDSTIALNEALTDGGGIFAVENLDSATNIYNSTIVYNDADEDRDGIGSGGGVHISGGNNSSNFNLRNSLVTGNVYANSPQTDDCTVENGATLDSYGVNLFGSIDGCVIHPVTGGWDYFTGNLGALQNNGGPTDTVALLANGFNNVIDGGAPCTDDQGSLIPYDQRGFARTVGSQCDVGAYEYDPDRIFFSGFD